MKTIVCGLFFIIGFCLIQCDSDWPLFPLTNLIGLCFWILLLVALWPEIKKDNEIR